MKLVWFFGFYFGVEMMFSVHSNSVITIRWVFLQRNLSLEGLYMEENKTRAFYETFLINNNITKYTYIYIKKLVSIP